MDGIKNFLQIINDNWTMILIIIGVAIVIYNRVMSYMTLTDSEKIEIAKKQVSETILRMVMDAETDYSDIRAAGSIKRSTVIKEVFEKYPILAKVVQQEEVIEWIDELIDQSLVTLRSIVEKNSEE